MGTSNYSVEFKRDAAHQITVRGYPVREVSRRLGMSTHFLYKWVKLFGDTAPRQPGVDHEAENRRLASRARYDGPAPWPLSAFGHGPPASVHPG